MGIKQQKKFSKREYHLYSLALLIILLGWIGIVNYLFEPFFQTVLGSGASGNFAVQTSAAGMDPALLKEKFGSRIAFWGGAINTQQTLPFGTKQDVAQEARDAADHRSPRENGGVL